MIVRTRLAVAVVLLVSAGAWLRAGVGAQGDRVTFTEQIAPMLYANCVTCHRPGEAAPFPLITYQDVSKRGALIARVTASRYMPPWHAVHGYGDFEDERRLTDEQIAVIAAWVKQGMPEGDPARLPPLPSFTDGWHLGKPDLVLEMPAGFDIPASGPDVYRNFVIPTGLTEDKWVRAVEFRPSARRVVHHALFAYLGGGVARRRDGADGQPGFPGLAPIGLVAGLGSGGTLGGWAVGTTPGFLPEGQSWPLPKGSDFILQMHFHPTGKPETERSVVGLYFADRPSERRLFGLQLPALFGLGSHLDIPAGEAHYTIRDSMTLPVDVRAFSVGAHAHYLGKEMKATATLPDGSTEPLLWISDWDFNWQDRYDYRTPLVLPKGTRIDVEVSYDNSADNPRNPSSPPKRVLWGEQSFDEMGSVALQVVTVRPDDEPELQQFLATRLRIAAFQAVQDGTAGRLRDQLRRR